jgi:LuxR family maltose regulon positive regulatory protein
MHNSLLATKLYIPPARQVLVPRLRLVEKLQNGLQGPLTLLSAPAGSGKTTLLSEWHAGIGSAAQVGWLSLAAEDNDLTRFLHYLSAALDYLQAGLAADCQPLLQTPETPDAEGVLTFLINRLNELKQESVLVLDDYHLIELPAIHKAVMFLLEQLPPRLHLVLLTRMDPPLPLARLRARGQLSEIRAEQLRFTVDECTEFLNHFMGLALTHEQVAALEKRTEGWIAGLQLAAISMQESKDVAAFVNTFTGSHHYVMDFLVEEVLKLQPENISAFLLQTSILDRLSEPLCKALLLDSDPGEGTLEALRQKNLFIIALDDEQRWYRYHHLFADVLRKRLVQASPQLIPELHRRASTWYEQNGFMAESIQQAIEAGDSDRAARLIEGNGCLLLISGEVTTLLNWANAIEFQADIHPWLAIQQAWALALVGQMERVEPTLRVPDQLLAPLEASPEVDTMKGTIAAARAYCANRRGETAAAEAYARDALDLLPDCSSISMSIRSVATSLLGDTSWINGNLEEAIRAYHEAARIGREAGNAHMVIIANSNLAEVYLEQGQLHRAADLYAQSLQMAVRPDGERSPLATSLYAGLGKIAYEQNRLEEAAQNFQLCIDLCKKWRDPALLAMACARLGRVEHARNRPQAAREAVQEAERITRDLSLSSRQSIQADSELASFWAAQGNEEKLSGLVEKRHLAAQDDIPYERQPEYLLLLRSLLAGKEPGKALELSERLLQSAETAGRTGLVIEVLILQALIFQGKKDMENALSALERALSVARPEGFVRSFLDEGQAMIRLLCQIRSRHPTDGYEAGLLSAIDQMPGMAQPSMQLLIEPLTGREIEILKLIEAGCSNQDIAEQLVLSLLTVKRHISNIYTKMGVQSRTQAIAMGKEFKLFE